MLTESKDSGQFPLKVSYSTQTTTFYLDLSFEDKLKDLHSENRPDFTFEQLEKNVIEGKLYSLCCYCCLEVRNSGKKTVVRRSVLRNMENNESLVFDENQFLNSTRMSLIPVRRSVLVSKENEVEGDDENDRTVTPKTEGCSRVVEEEEPSSEYQPREVSNREDISEFYEDDDRDGQVHEEMEEDVNDEEKVEGDEVESNGYLDNEAEEVSDEEEEMGEGEDDLDEYEDEEEEFEEEQDEEVQEHEVQKESESKQSHCCLFYLI